MRVLLDASTPVPLRRFLRGHAVTCSYELGWHTLANGELLTVAESAGYELLITCDQNLRYQQNFTGRTIAVLVLSTNRWPRLRANTAKIASAVDFMQRGQVVRLEMEE